MPEIVKKMCAIKMCMLTEIEDISSDKSCDNVKERLDDFKTHFK